MSINNKAENFKINAYADIAELDPLDLDHAMRELPNWNIHGLTDAILDRAGKSVTTAGKISARGDAVAALRDLDFLAGSLVKHGIDPVQSVSGLETELLRLGAIAETVPRGTVYTYSVINPVDERMRTFTGSVEEKEFIGAVRVGTLALDQAVTNISCSLESPDSALSEALASSATNMDTMIASILKVREKVSPQFFTHEMRPFFDPLKIGGEKFTGAGGAQMQLIAVDRMLWGIDDSSEDYEAFYEENERYLTPAQRDSVNQFAQQGKGESLLTLFEKNPEKYPLSIEQAASLLRKIRKFRYPHRKVAQDNFNIRKAGSVGSGSYTTGILDVLIDKTEHAMHRLEAVGDIQN